jgi:hypothetical protein
VARQEAAPIAVPVATLLSLFPKLEDVLGLTPEDLVGVIIELMPPLLQNGLFNPVALLGQVYQPVGPSYPPGSRRTIELAVAEAISWLVTEGIRVPDPGQPSPGFQARADNLMDALGHRIESGQPSRKAR